MNNDPRARVAKRIRDPQDECHDRVRRIETRLTQFMVAMGVPTAAQKPVFDPGSVSGRPARITLPSPHSSMKEILDNIPKTWEGPIRVFVGDEMVATIDGRGAGKHERPQI